MKNVENSISREFNFFSLIKFATPTVIMMRVTALYTIIDSIFVSRYVGTNGLSAINIIYPVINVLMAIAIMFSTGGSAVIARKLGSGDEKEARRNLSLIYITGFLLSVVSAVACMFFIKPLIYGLGATEVLFDLCKQYLTIMLLFAPALVIQIFGQSFIVVAGNPNFGLTLSIISGVVNMILDYIFIAIWISPYMMEIFTPVGSNVYDIAISGFPLFSLSFLFVGINIFASSLFTALSNGEVSAIISFLRTFVFIIAGLTILPPLFHVPGIWLSVPAAELLAMVMSIGFILAYGRRYKYI